MVIPGMVMAGGREIALSYTLHWLLILLGVSCSTGEDLQEAAGANKALKMQLPEEVRKVIEKSNPKRGEIYASIADDETAGMWNFSLDLDKYGPDDVPESFGSVQYAKIYITGAAVQQKCAKEKCKIALLVKTVLSLKTANIQALCIENVHNCKEGSQCSANEICTDTEEHERVMLNVKELRLNRVSSDVCAILLARIEFEELEDLIVMGEEVEAHASIGALKCKKIQNLRVTGASAQQVEEKKQAEINKTATAVDPEAAEQRVHTNHADTHKEEPAESQPGTWSIPIAYCDAQGDVRGIDPALLCVETELSIRHELWESLKKSTQRDVKAKTILIEGVAVQELARQNTTEPVEKNKHTQTLELQLSTGQEIPRQNAPKEKKKPEARGQLVGIMKALDKIRENEIREKEGMQNTTTAVSWVNERFGALDFLVLKSHLSFMPLSLPSDGSEQYAEISGKRLKQIRLDYKKKRTGTGRQRDRHFSKVELRQPQSQSLLPPQLQCGFSVSDSDLTSDEYTRADPDTNTRGYSQLRSCGRSDEDNKTEKGQRRITARI